MKNSEYVKDKKGQWYMWHPELMKYIALKKELWPKEEGTTIMDEDKVREETQEHIDKVGEKIDAIIKNLLIRKYNHDKTKLKSPEFEIFCEFTPKLKDSTYGSDEYKGFLKEMKPALDHHYAENSHHPEHYEEGIDGMDIVDLIEMLCDWKASTERHEDGDISKSIEINKDRFNMSDQLVNILKNSIKLFQTEIKC